ncbi:MAG: TetR/AcrR family transcriptional regulator [Deltaproteobacteria bacterium]|nr:TetR/AcrR family transcriptional regulator [Deltaproteobacteria bacterium]
MMSKKNSKPGDVKQRIFDEAIRLFGESGYEGTSIQAISEAVGIRKPSLLYHFSSKDELREAVIVKLIAAWAEELPRLLTNAKSGHDRFSSTITSVVEFFLEDRNRARLAIREMMDRPTEIQAVVRERLSPWTKMLVEYILMGQGSGVIKAEVEPQAYLTQVMMMIIGTVAVGGVAGSMLGADNETIEPMIKELVRIAREALFVDKSKKES